MYEMVCPNAFDPFVLSFFRSVGLAGQQGEDFFLIEEGVVSCTQAKSATDPTEMSLLTLGPGEYFGEMALMLDEPRAANCIAVQGNVGTFSLSLSFFFVVVFVCGVTFQLLSCRGAT